MKLVYFGTGSFALPALEALAQNVVLVVTQPDRPSGRGMKLQASPAKVLAERLGIEVATPEKARSLEFVERLEALRPDALVVASYGQILSERVLNSALRGGINLHGSILPKYRGAAPIQRAILDGCEETGITLMQMDRGMDSGDIIDIQRTSILPDETYGQLQEKLSLIAADLAKDWLPKIVEGNYPRIPQDASQMSLAPKVERAETELSVDRTAEEEYRRFRAFTPAPSVFIQTRAGRLKVLEARYEPEGTAVAGTVLSFSDGLTVAFATGAIRFIRVQPEGKNRMDGSAYALGARLKTGDRLI